MIKRTCKICNKVFNVIPCLIKKTHKSKFCSLKCAGKWRSENLCDKKNYNWRGGKIKKTCQVCKKKFKVNSARKNIAKFCSNKCYGTWRSENMKGKNNHHWMGGKTKQICIYCRKEFMIWTSPSSMKKGKGKFCSKECYSQWMSENLIGKKAFNWQGGISFEPYGLAFNNELKEQIRIRDNYRCQQCFRHQNELFTKSGKKRKLYVHHIDYNKQNNNLKNLISLCINCHTQTNFSRENWANYFSGKVLR